MSCCNWKMGFGFDHLGLGDLALQVEGRQGLNLKYWSRDARRHCLPESQSGICQALDQTHCNLIYSIK